MGPSVWAPWPSQRVASSLSTYQHMESRKCALSSTISTELRKKTKAEVDKHADQPWRPGHLAWGPLAAGSGRAFQAAQEGGPSRERMSVLVPPPWRT